MTKPHLTVCMPTRGAVSIESMLGLMYKMDDYEYDLLVEFRKPVVEARNALARRALELENPYVLFVDDDAWWPAGTVDKAVAILEDHPDVAMVIGAYCGRLPYLPPLAIVTDGKDIAAVNLMSHEPGQLIDVHLTGMHWNLVRRSVLEGLGPNPFDRIPATAVFPADSPERLREDESFTWNVHKVGRIVTERTLIVGHVDVQTGRVYMPNQPAMIANGLGAPLYDAALARLEPPVRTSDVRTYFEEPTATAPAATEPTPQPAARPSTGQTQRFIETAIAAFPHGEVPPALGSLAWNSLSAIERAAVFTEDKVRR